MPTPVSAARQCLTPDAARAVEEAVSVARRRAHSQTTSLHAVSALLALPSSLLRDACSRARSSAYSPRLQLRALELCFSVSLDRLPSSQTLDEPPISNSLMAAIKRSQANQRRNPDTYHQYQSFQPNQSQNSVLLIKVELRQLVLSVLDDPLVSRVFGEAGFRSTDIKLAIIRPPGPRFPRARFPPLFLCNFAQTHPDASDFDDNCRRMCEVLLQKKKKNLFLIGVSAREAVRNFRNCLEKGEMGPQFPREIAGLKFVCVEKDVAEGSVRSRCEELERSAAAAGVVVDVGDLKGFPDDGAAVAELSRVLELHHDSRLWLVGSAANYETYMKFLTRHPMVEKDWDLQLLPITSIRSGVGGLHPRPHSLMESFVPFGGFFPMLPDLKSPVSSTYQSPSRCRLCDENYEEELAAIVKGSSISVSDQQQASVPTCLQRGDLMGINCGWDLAEAKDDGSVLSTKVMVLQKKWNDICLRLHRSNQILEPDSYRMGPPLLPGVGFPFIADRKEIVENQNGKSTNTSADQCERKNEFLMLKDSQKISQPYQSMSVPVVSELKNDDLLCKFNSRLAKTEELRKEGPQSPSVTSVTTDLMLGTNFAHVKEQKKDPLRNCKDRLKDVSGCFPVEDYSDSVVQNTYLMKGGLATRDQQCLDSSDATKRFNPRDFKSIWRALTEMVGRQEAAICAISQTIAHCKSANERRRGASLKGDIWLSFLGPDRMGKKKIAVALAELVSGSKEKLICVDLCSHDFGIPPNTIVNLGQEMSGYDAKFRGKTVIDYIADEISRNPLAVVFLENVDKADLLLQDSLCQAVKTGKFRNSHGREIGVNNSIFVTTARWVRSKPAFNEKDTVNFSEERVSAAQGWQMQILIARSSKRMTDISSNVLVTSLERPRDKKGSSSQVFVNKRKLEDFEQVHSTAKMCLDLNLSIEEMEENVIDSGDEETDSLSENSKAWLEEFLDLVDETVNFKTFDFDALADNILKKIRGIFQNSIGSEGSLEIDSKCMEHILAATWVSDGTKHVDDWIENVLRKCFIDARERCGNFFAPVLKLVTCEGSYMEEQAPGVCLPAGIILN